MDGKEQNCAITSHSSLSPRVRYETPMTEKGEKGEEEGLNRTMVGGCAQKRHVRREGQMTNEPNLEGSS
jgi:hypothetical protein